MPPTPFAPSHSSPFKSTLSSAQQARSNHSSDAETIELSVQNIEPTHWTYHCEGGKNVLLSLDSRTKSTRFVHDDKPLALRIAKSNPESNAEDDDADRFTQEVIMPLLGGPSLLPFVLKLPLRNSRERSMIDTLAAAIEMHRPTFRRESSSRINADRISHVHAIEDVTARALSDEADTLCIEIKPKWGFLPRTKFLPSSSPNTEVKARFSRYKMHRVAKSAEAGIVMTVEQFNELYDPQDLYSPHESRKRTAIIALFKDWQASNGTTNNLRLFWNGNIVAPDDEDTMASIGRFLNKQIDSQLQGNESLLEGLIRVLVSELSKRQIPPLHTAQPPCTVLDRLAFLQSTLDPFDVEGLAALWLELTGCQTLGDLGARQHQLDPASASLLSSPRTIDEVKSCVSNLTTLDNETETISERTPTQALAQHICRFLLSSTFKDCSLLIRCDKAHDGLLHMSTKIIDLDMKPVGKLAKFQATDRLVCSEFLKWKAELATEPAPSRAARLS